MEGMTVTIVDVPRPVTGGVDTHLDLNVAAALDPVGGLLAVQEFPADVGGDQRLPPRLAGFGAGGALGAACGPGCPPPTAAGTSGCSPGWPASGRWAGSAWKAPAPTEPGWPATCAPRAGTSSRGTAPAGRARAGGGGH